VFLLVAVAARDVIMALVRSLMGLQTVPRLWLTPPTEAEVGPATVLYAFIGASVTIALTLGAYRLFVRWMEARQPDEVGRPVATDLGVGTLVGSAFVLTMVGAVALAGSFAITARNPLYFALIPLASAATAAAVEELLVRGLLLRILEEKLGSLIALALTAVIFGGLHAANSGATIRSTIAIAVSAGLILGAAFILTRSLWLAIGMHFGVNATQGALLGLPVSGARESGWLESSLSGNSLLTGGAFGLENSILVIPIGIGVAAVLLTMAIRRGRIRPAPWRPR
jgi:membrane protease YdiL (CAAX protease family)